MGAVLMEGLRLARLGPIDSAEATGNPGIIIHLKASNVSAQVE